MMEFLLLRHYLPGLDPAALTFRRYCRTVARLPDLIRFLAGKPVAPADATRQFLAETSGG